MQFQQSVLQQEENSEEPEQHALETAMPLLARVIASQSASVNEAIRKMANQVGENTDELKKMIADELQKLRHTPLYLGGSPGGSPEPSSSHSRPNTPSDTAIPVYKLDRSHKTVIQVWQEHEEGLPGCMPVRTLEQMYGTKWRADPTESKYYSRRKVIYDELNRMAIRDRVSPKEAAIRLEETRKYHSRPLDTLCTMIKDNSSQ